MIPLHFIGLLTLELLAITAAFFLYIYIRKEQLSSSYKHFSTAILVLLHAIIVFTIVHAIVHHFNARHDKGFNHGEFFEKHHGQDGHFDHEKQQGGEEDHH